MLNRIETSYRFRSPYSYRRIISARRNAYINSARVQSANADTFTRSHFDPSGEIENNSSCYYLEHREELHEFSESLKSLTRLELRNIKRGDYSDTAKSNFDIIKYCETSLNKNISKYLEEAGVPKDVTFEFDFHYSSDMVSGKIEITKISDEKYRETVENILSGSTGPFTIISCASRVMNGYISSLYYPWISKALDRCFGQDINDLSIDENGNLRGVNKNLQAAFDAEKKAEEKGEYFCAVQEFNFPVNNIEAIVKRLVSEENITPNISHMGYDGECIYTNDGEFKFGKDFDPNLFSEEKYVMRGASALYLTVYNHTSAWIENYEKFY